MRQLLLLLALLMAPAAAAQENHDAFIVVNNAARQRSAPAAAALASLLRETGRLGELADAWSDFAAALNWEEGPAFDQLLGRRVMLVLRGLEQGGVQEWAILSEVTAEAEKRLSNSLKPAPRGLAQGHTVLGVERGRYELAISRGGWKPEVGNRATFILLAPTGGKLFDDLIPLLSGGRFSVEGGDDADVYLLVRRPLAPAFEGGPQRSHSFEVRATMDQDRLGWTATLRSTTFRPPGEITPWSTATFESVQRDSLVAIMGVLGAPPLADLGRWFGMPAVALPKGVGQRAALVIREVGAPPFGLVRADHRWHPAGHNPAGNGVTITLAVESADLPRLVSRGDTLAASMVPFLNGQAAVAALLQQPVEFDAGLTEHSVRFVELQPDPGALGASFGPDPVFTWAFGRSKPAFAQLLGAKVNAGAPGWWVMSLAPKDVVRAVSPTETLRDLFAQELLDPLQVQRLSVGVVRPSALQAYVGNLDPGLTAALLPGRWVESIRWDSWLNPAGMVEGELRVRMAPGP